MRRSVFIVLLVALIGFGIYRYTLIKDNGRRRVSEKYTPAEHSKIDPSDVPTLSAIDAEYTRIVSAVIPSVVSIVRQRKLQTPQIVDPFSYLFGNRRTPQQQERFQTALGSGVIVSREGHVLTNHHVIKDMDKIEVQLTDGRNEPATLVGSDELTDIAVLKIDAQNIEPLPFGDSDEVRVGQMVFAVGNPFGLSETVTKGIISAKARRAVTDSSVEFLQTDAAVNQGNSGGPLLNLRGEIVGINTAIYSQSGGWLGISFAVPSNVARRALESLLKNGKIIRGYLGVVMTNVTPDLARELGVKEATGALVTEVVAGSPAEKSGLQPRDIVRKVNGSEVADILALRSRIVDVEIGGNVELVVTRGGKELTLAAKIIEAPADLPAPGQLQPGPQPQPQPKKNNQSGDGPAVLDGVSVGELTRDAREHFPEGINGVLVTQLQPNCVAGTKLRVGDVIQEVNRQPVQSVADYDTFVRALGLSDRVLLYICRGNARLYVPLSP